MVAWIKLLHASPNSPEDKHRIYKEQMTNWYVICSVTGEQIPIADLCYWNVEKNEVYKSPQVMPLYDRYETKE